MHSSTMFCSRRACSCQNFSPKLSVSQLGWGQSLWFNYPRLAGNVFTVFVPLRCNGRLIHQDRPTPPPNGSHAAPLCEHCVNTVCRRCLPVRLLLCVAAWGGSRGKRAETWESSNFLEWTKAVVTWGRTATLWSMLLHGGIWCRAHLIGRWVGFYFSYFYQIRLSSLKKNPLL